MFPSFAVEPTDRCLPTVHDDRDPIANEDEVDDPHHPARHQIGECRDHVAIEVVARKGDQDVFNWSVVVVLMVLPFL